MYMAGTHRRTYYAYAKAESRGEAFECQVLANPLPGAEG